MARKRKHISKNNGLKSKESLYDKMLGNLKNNPFVVSVLIGAAIITGIFTFIEPFQKFFSKEEYLEISTIRAIQNSDDSMIDVIVRNKSDVDAIITKIELIIEKKWIDTKDVIEPIGWVLGATAIYDFLLNPVGNNYPLDIAQQIMKNSADRFFLVVALGEYDSHEDCIKSTDYEKLKIKAHLKFTYNDNKSIESKAIIFDAYNKGNNHVVKKHGQRIDAYIQLLYSREFHEASHGINLIKLIGDTSSLRILKEFQKRDLSYLKKEYEKTYNGPMYYEDDILWDYPPNERMKNFINELNESVEALERKFQK